MGSSTTLALTPAGNGTRTLAAADFDQDGKLDLVVGNEFASSVLVLYGRGNGQFENQAGVLGQPQVITVPGGQLGLWAGPFTSDLYPDLAVSLKATNQVVVLKNNGNRSFTTSATTTVGKYPATLTSGDFDRNGKLDLAVVNFLDNSVSLLFGNGLGGISQVTTSAAGQGPTALIAADLDNDGDTDLAVANKTSRSLSFLRNLGNGSFSAPDNLGVGNLSADTSFAVAALRIDGDSTVDLVVAKGENNQASLLYNQLTAGGHRSTVTGTNTVSGLDFALQSLANAPAVSLSLANNNLAENQGGATVIATLSNRWGLPITVNLNFSGAATHSLDYTRSNTQLSFDPGQTSASLTLTALEDLLSEAPESILVDISSVSGGTENGGQQVTASITDNDPQPTVSLQLTGRTIAENGGNALVTANLNTIAGQEVTVTLAFSGSATLGSDYSASATQLRIPAGQTAASLILVGLDDSTSEPNESLFVAIQALSGGTENGPQLLSAVMADDDFQTGTTPTVSLQLQGSPLAENGGQATVLANLSATSSQNVTVNFGFSGAATAGSDYSASSTSLLIPAGQLSGSITLTALDDLLAEGNESLLVEITSVTNANENGTQQVTASITDDDASNPFDLNGNTLTLNGTSGNDTFGINYGSSTRSFTATVNGVSGTFSATTINVVGAAGNDRLDLTLSPLADQATLAGTNGFISTSSYTISYSNVSTVVLNGEASDHVTYNDPGVVSTAYLLPAYGILQGGGFSNQAIGFGSHTVNATGNDDNLFIYGDSGAQAYVATPTQARMPVGSQLLLGNNFKRVYAYGMGGTDTATYSGSALDETMTALAFYTFVNTASTVQYFDRFQTLTVAGNGGLDIAVMYDSAGVDTFTASDSSFQYLRTGVFNNLANGYDKVYAFSLFGSFDTATLNGSSGNDKLTSIANYSVLVTPTTLQQATSFRTVIVNAGTGTDTATLQDSAGNDTLNAFASTAELVYANGRTVRAIGFDTVNANGTLGGTNRRNLNSPAYQLKFKGTWV